ncbi:MAG: riboflavin synthase [Trueperaceae bacterium]|nr:MAG: riboflavin synthase [Trueperaceae bacterium]
MFTGIVEEVGVIENVLDTGGDLRVSIRAERVLGDLAIGDSIAVSGCCLTVVSLEEGSFTVELSKETVAKTAPRWQEGIDVNLERAMRADSRFGGHLVSGHVEATGQVLSVEREPGAYVIRVKATPTLAKYLIPKGSITVDGVSLTVVDVGGPAGSEALATDEFTLWLIPHTLEITTLGQLKAGDKVNLEADLVAKYLERLTLMEREATHVP